MHTFKMLAAIALAIASLLAIASSGVVPTHDNGVAIHPGFDFRPHHVQTAVRIIPTMVADSTVLSIIDATPTTTATTQHVLSVIEETRGTPTDKTTFETVTTSAHAAIKTKRAGCYVTTVNGSQDKITRTVCPAPASTCVPCVGCNAPQC